MKHGFTILMQYGNTEEWSEAKDEIAFQMPAHILPDDFRQVLDALEKLERKSTQVITSCDSSAA